MSNFIQGENFDKESRQAEEIVWKKIKEIFSDRDLLGYSRYPLFAEIGERRKEPDILLLDRELGVIIIEVRDFTIDDIAEIKDDNWFLGNYNTNIINPVRSSEDYLYSIKSKFDLDRNLRGKYKGVYFVALPNIERSEWIYKKFNEYVGYESIIFKDDLNKSSIISLILNSKSAILGSDFRDETFCVAKSIIGHEKNHVTEIDFTLKEGTKGRIYNEIRNKLYDLDIQQEAIGKTIPPGPQRIRGIAGSGKTILICQKAAYMHLRHPDWKIAVVFFTQSLYDTITNTIDMYIRAFTNGQLHYDSSSNLKILHAWGRKDKNGFYREIAAQNDCHFINASKVKESLGKLAGPNTSINYISKKLLNETEGNLKEILDAVLIDEGQDLVGDDEYKYEGKQAFYYMAYKSLKPVSNGDSKLRRLIWAYDELQSLNDKKIPSSKEIFGNSSLVTGIYSGGIKKSEIMKKCYRTPYQILTTAHAVGMGFFREDGMLSGYTTKKDWENIGYEVVSGDFRKEGNELIISRPIENSPNPMKGDCIFFELFDSESEMLNELAANIKDDIVNQKLNPSRDILVINLKEIRGWEFEQRIGDYLNEKNIDYYSPSCDRVNILYTSGNYSVPERFWTDGAVTISKIARAKGNEAPMVYVVGIEEIAEKESSVAHRNKLFTALTRAKCWVKIMGVGDKPLYNEIKKSIESRGTFKFKYVKPKNESNDMEA